MGRGSAYLGEKVVREKEYLSAIVTRRMRNIQS
jgi:hypothetical protein